MVDIKMQELIKKFGLKPLWIENLWAGDYLSEFYTSSEIIPKDCLAKKFDGNRPIINWAYHLFPENSKSYLHKLYADESWQFCLGDPIDIYIFSSCGILKKITIGNNITEGHKLIYIIPKDHWFGAIPRKGSGYSFVTHAISPAYYKQDMEKCYEKMIFKKYPQHEQIIKKLAWPEDK